MKKNYFLIFVTLLLSGTINARHGGGGGHQGGGSTHQSGSSQKSNSGHHHGGGGHRGNHGHHGRGYYGDYDLDDGYYGLYDGYYVDEPIVEEVLTDNNPEKEDVVAARELNETE